MQQNLDPTDNVVAEAVEGCLGRGPYWDFQLRAPVSCPLVQKHQMYERGGGEMRVSVTFASAGSEKAFFLVQKGGRFFARCASKVVTHFCQPEHVHIGEGKPQRIFCCSQQ